MLLLMEFLTGYEGDLYQENINGTVTRWFDMIGNEVALPDNDGAGVSYRCKDKNPPIPPWYNVN